MCGIVGVFLKDPQGQVDPKWISDMRARIVHRGPDDDGEFVEGRIGMGMQRLAIIDLAGGKQPIYNEDESVVTVFNGEIFNFQDLRKELSGQGHRFATSCDTEVLVHGYEQWGNDLPRHLNGMFGFSVWSRREQRLLLARDHIGIKPLYIYEDDDAIAWASEIKSLLALPFVRAERDDYALVDYLTLGYTAAPRTMFRNIRKLPPASLLSIDTNGSSERVYWDPSFEADSSAKRDWSEEFLTLFDDALKRQLVSDVPLGAFLSGGIDSTGIVTSMRHLGVDEISTYAIGFGQKDAFHSELDKARVAAEYVGATHHEIVVEPNVTDLFESLIYHLDEPVTDTSFVVTYLVSKLARESVTVILSGVGGDELFGGYRRYLWPYLARYYNWIPGPVDRHVVRPLLGLMPIDRGSRWKSLARYMSGFLEHADKTPDRRYQGYVSIFSDDLLANILQPALAEKLKGRSADAVARNFRAARADDHLGRMLYADIKTSLVDSLLAFTDKMTMATSLEARVPYLDYRLVELAGQMPSDMKIKDGRHLKHIMKTSLHDRLPPSLRQQRKQGFGTPISRWFREELKDYLAEMLSPASVRARGLFEPAAVAQLMDDHYAERADHSEHLLALLTLEIWHRQFIDQG